MRRIILAVATITALLSLALVTPANATYIGGEGKIAFVRANQVYTVAKTGGTVKQLTTSGKNYRPKWSPDGKRIAYINETAAGTKDVWTMTATGGSKTKVTSTGDLTAAATWSPDGKTLAYGAGPFENNQDCAQCEATVYLINSTKPAGAPRTITATDWRGDPTPVTVEKYLAWAPDGDRLAYFNGRSEDTFDWAIHYYYFSTGREDVMDGTGASCCRNYDWSDLVFGPSGLFGYGQVDHGFDEDPDLSLTTIVYPGFASQEGDKSPAPSPTNKHMAFVRNTSSTNTTPNIWTATIKGAQRKVIVTNGYQPDWQPLP